MRWWIFLALGLTGCVLDPRPQALRRGLDQVRSVLADPRLQSLAAAGKPGKTPEERLVETLFADSARGLWPPRLPEEHTFDYRDQAKLPGRITYLRTPVLPWSVVVIAEPKHHRIVLHGYGASLEKPMLRDEFPVPR